MASAIAENMNKIEEVFLPPHICKGIPVEFAIDNTDFSTDQKLEFHGTGQLVFQKRKRSSKKTFKFNIFNVHSNSSKPKPPNETFNDFNRIIVCDAAFHQKQNWAEMSIVI